MLIDDMELVREYAQRDSEATFVITECGFPDYINKAGNAIYRIAGRTLTLAGDEPGDASKPTVFEASPVTQTRLFVFHKP